MSYHFADGLGWVGLCVRTWRAVAKSRSPDSPSAALREAITWAHPPPPARKWRRVLRWCLLFLACWRLWPEGLGWLHRAKRWLGVDRHRPLQAFQSNRFGLSLAGVGKLLQSLTHELRNTEGGALPPSRETTEYDVVVLVQLGGLSPPLQMIGYDPVRPQDVQSINGLSGRFSLINICHGSTSLDTRARLTSYPSGSPSEPAISKPRTRRSRRPGGCPRRLLPNTDEMAGYTSMAVCSLLGWLISTLRGLARSETGMRRSSTPSRNQRRGDRCRGCRQGTAGG